jgi:hypothetical protein
MDRNDSSTSHYSEELNRDQESAVRQGQEGQGYADIPPPAIAPAAQVYTNIPSTQEYISPIGQTPTDGPPGYEHHESSSSYPVDKTGHTDEPAPYTEHPIGTSSTQAPVSQASPAQTEGMTEGERLEWEQYYADQQLAQQANTLVLNHGKEDESLR